MDGIEYTVNAETKTAAVTGYEGTPVNVAIPATVNIEGTNYPVTAISNGAFDYCGTLQSITLPERLLTIGNYAFSGCNALQTITLPEGLQTIGDEAFESCEALQSIVLPDGLQTIGYEAFRDCSALQSIIFPEGLQSIGNYAFSYCIALESVIASKGVAAIGSSAFYQCTALQSVTFSEGLQTIGQDAFFNCSSLESVTFPEGLQSIGNHAFYQCIALESITFSEGVQNIGMYVFYYCPLETIICLSATPPAISSYTFDSNTYANATLHVPTGAWAAYQADPYWEGLIPYPIIDGMLYRIDFSAQRASVTDAETGITTATVLATVEYDGTEYPVISIGFQAFSGCSALQSVTLPEGLQTIGDYAFYNCPLTDITCNAVTPPAISFSTFDENTDATATLHVPAEAWAAYQAATYWESLIRYPQIDGIEYYIDFAAQEASVSDADENITTANILASVEHDGTEYPVIAIDNEAFASCRSLQSVTLPEGLQTIGERAFYNCTALQSIDLPSTMLEIGSGAFENAGLRDVYSRAVTPPSIYDDTFSQSTYRLATLHVPAEAVENYRSAMGWVLFDHIESSLPPVSIEEMATDASLATYAGGILTTESPASITVYAQNGAVVRHAADATTLSLENLPNGLYIICIAQNSQRQVLKVVR